MKETNIQQFFFIFTPQPFRGFFLETFANNFKNCNKLNKSLKIEMETETENTNPEKQTRNAGCFIRKKVAGKPTEIRRVNLKTQTKILKKDRALLVFCHS